MDTDGPYEITARAILIEEELDAALERKAREEGKSNAALIREYVGERLASLPPLATDPLARMAAADEFEPRPIHEVVYG